METKIVSQDKGAAKLGVAFPAETLVKELDNLQVLYRKEGKEKSRQELLRDAVQKIVNNSYPNVIRESGLAVASQPTITVLKADEENGIEITLEFALRPEVKLGRYKGIRVKMPEVTETAEYAAALAQAESQNRQTVAVERPARLGDVTLIDFAGYLDGVAFDGGTGSNYPLTLGSGQFIPGFEEQLVGASAGDAVDVNVTFPEQYHAPDLAGKAVVFKVTVKKVQEIQTQPLSDEQKQNIAMQMADSMIEDMVLQTILAEAEVDIPDLMVDGEANILFQQFAAEIQAQQMDVEQYCQRLGKTMEEVRQAMYPRARRQIQLRLVLNAIAEEEHITASEEEVENYWDMMAQQYGMPKDMIKQYMAGAETEIRSEIVSQKAYALLRENTVLEQ